MKYAFDAFHAAESILTPYIPIMRMTLSSEWNKIYYWRLFYKHIWHYNYIQITQIIYKSYSLETSDNAEVKYLDSRECCEKLDAGIELPNCYPLKQMFFFEFLSVRVLYDESRGCTSRFFTAWASRSGASHPRCDAFIVVTLLVIINVTVAGTECHCNHEEFLAS